jgi:hypothetical protein
MVSDKGEESRNFWVKPEDREIADTYCREWETDFWDNMDDKNNGTGEAPNDKGEVEGQTEPEKKINKLAYGNPRGYLPPNPKPVKNPWLPPELDPNFGKKKFKGKSIKKNKKKSDDGDEDSKSKKEEESPKEEPEKEEEDIDPDDPFAAMKAKITPDTDKIEKKDEEVLDKKDDDDHDKKEGTGVDHSDPDHDDKGVKAKNEHQEQEGGSENDDPEAI